MENPIRTYISLFSSAGIGCYGFKLEGFECIATCELLERRIKIQAYNKKCRYEAGYISGDMTQQETQDKILKQYEYWKKHHQVKELDVVVATPPCQGMSVANHKKIDEVKELKRNSLVVESIKMIKELNPKFFVMENVRSFLTTGCMDIDGKYKAIDDAIKHNLAGLYNIYARVVNFKDYGNLSSRPRTLVVGVRKDLKDVSPFSIFPDRQKEKTLREVIGHLPALHTMGEMWEQDFYHQFKSYSPNMEAWIAPLQEGQSAFDNEDAALRPHQIVNGQIVPNVRKNGDKYTRCYWDKVAPCVHTRNDILASQNTIHPQDNRVYSIRELMLMMSVPESYQWSETPYEELQAMTDEDKRKFLKKEEINIRQNLGEAVPTIIFKQIAHKIKEVLARNQYTEVDIKQIIQNNNLTDSALLKEFVKNNHKLGFVMLSKIAELANALREDNAAYYTGQDICYSVAKYLPDVTDGAEISIIEPSVGLGNFLPTLFVKYANAKKVYLDVCDIDPNSIEILKELLKTLKVPANFKINIINTDTLLYVFTKHYDIAVGNPPYMKFSGEKQLLARYKFAAYNQDTNNLFAFFIDKAIQLADYVALIVPKSLINAPEFNATRELMNRTQISHIVDYGEKAFKGVKIETVSFVLNTKKKPSTTIVESYITNNIKTQEQVYITDPAYPYWLIYRNEDFDKVAAKLTFGIFTSYRDRAITKQHTSAQGKYRVLKSRNIGSNEIINIEGYDSYMDDLTNFSIAKYLDADNCYLVPNLTYYPRACKMPKGCIVDGSVAILTPKEESSIITEEDLAYYATEEFTAFYKIARNNGTRSLNIDNNSVFFFGLLNKQ